MVILTYFNAFFSSFHRGKLFKNRVGGGTRTVRMRKHSQQFSSARVLQNSGIAVSVGDENVPGRNGHGHGSGLTKRPVSLPVLESLSKRQRGSERSGRELRNINILLLLFINFLTKLLFRC